MRQFLNHKKVSLLYSMIVLVSFLMDQITKWLVLQYKFGLPFFKSGVTYAFPTFPYQLWYAVTPFFNISYVWNHGVSFGLFQSQSLVGRLSLVIFAVVIVLFILWWVRSSRSLFVGVALSFVMGGALGNILDRIRLGAVFDFLDFYVGKYHWPSFNIADTCITVGILCVVVHALFAKDQAEDN